MTLDVLRVEARVIHAVHVLLLELPTTPCLLILCLFSFSPLVSSTLEKLEVAESEFTHVSIWGLGKAIACRV